MKNFKFSNKKNISNSYYDGLMKEIHKWERENGEKITGFGFRSIEYSYAMQHQHETQKAEDKRKKQKTLQDRVLER